MGWWSKVIARLRFLYCGCGDTILLGFSPRQWGLIDCNLTHNSGCWPAIRGQIEQNRIQRLRFVCLSHPDRDHYRGMRELLQDRFVEPDTNTPRFDQFWDSGVPFALLAAIETRLGRKLLAEELTALYRDFVAPHIHSGAVEPCELSDSRDPIEVGQFRFRSIGPRTRRVRRFADYAAEKILETPLVPREVVKSIKEDTNNLSAVLVLEHKRRPLRFLFGRSLRFLFGGDATTDAWREALDRWDELCRSTGTRDCRFEGIKVSHHGAKDGLSPRLYHDYCRPRKTVAIISNGANDPNHPHPEVLHVLRREQISVYSTCWPKSPGPAARGYLPLPGRPVPQPAGPRTRSSEYECNDITVEILASGKLRVYPKGSLLPLDGRN